MENFYDYKKFAILYVDDEEKSLKYFSRIFGKDFRVLTASNARDGYEILEANQDEIAILITDQKMPGEKGVQLLEKVRRRHPRIIRILATAHSDLEAAINAVNAGAIYRYVHKPWVVHELEFTLRRGMEFFLVQRERDQLLREKLSVLHNMMMTDRVVSLGVLAAGLGHHIRNSMVAIRTFLDLAPAKLRQENVNLEKLRNPNFWREFYESVQGQVGRILEMVNELGYAADPTPLLFQEEVRINEVIASVLNQMEPQFRSRRIEVENRVTQELPTLLVDGRKFHRLFELFLEDELEHLAQGGRIRLEASTSGDRDGIAEIQLEIQDDGPGLPEEALSSIFDPFFVRNDNPQDFGLRLMACFFIVYHHGGRVEVKSQEGLGTRFLMTFPLKPEVTGLREEGHQFVSKVLWNENLWEKLLSGA